MTVLRRQWQSNGAMSQNPPQLAKNAGQYTTLVIIAHWVVFAITKDRKLGRMNYEMEIKILEPDYTDSLIVSLVRQGYDVYKNGDKVYLTVPECDLREIKEPK